MVRDPQVENHCARATDTSCAHIIKQPVFVALFLQDVEQRKPNISKKIKFKSAID